MSPKPHNDDVQRRTGRTICGWHTSGYQEANVDSQWRYPPRVSVSRWWLRRLVGQDSRPLWARSCFVCVQAVGVCSPLGSHGHAVSGAAIACVLALCCSWREWRTGGGWQGGCTAAVWLPRRASSCKLRCSLDVSNASAAPPAVDLAPPTIDLEILGPEVGGDVTTTSVGSGEKLLRNIILENKLELYGLYGKVMNCGGGGSCGTCVVEILEGKELLNERTDTEYKYLKKKPESWRLSCQTIVGDKSNSGKVVVQRLPQKKK